VVLSITRPQIQPGRRIVIVQDFENGMERAVDLPAPQRRIEVRTAHAVHARVHKTFVLHVEYYSGGDSARQEALVAALEWYIVDV
jgi:hypothetical protein